ncbi:hypothetical protein KCU62_g9127, partial [Aureobasidium sp. EXF-3399]
MTKSPLSSARPNLYLEDMAELTTSKSDCSCRLTTLPTEIIQAIFENITNQRDILNVMITCKSLAHPAEEALWQVCNIRGYAKLPTMNAEQQDRFLMCIRKQTLHFERTGIQPRDLRIQPPRLQELSVEHLSAASVNNPVNISSFIKSSLIRLEVRNGTTDGFLPALNLLRGLKHLKIGSQVQVQGGDPLSFLRLIQTIPPLVTLFGGSLSSTELFVVAASGKVMRELGMTVHVDHTTVIRALQVPDAFANLRRLCLWTPASAACELLPKLTTLQSLQLDVSQDLLPGETFTSAAVSVFRAIGTMDKLLVLDVTLRDFGVSVQPGMFQPLTHLTRLEKLSINHDLVVNFHHRNIADFLPLSRLCPLEHLHLETEHRVPSRWIASLARQHPGLKTLSLGALVKIIPLKAHFPALESLMLYYPTLPCESSHAHPLMRQLATKMLAIAPRLKQVQVNFYSSASRDIVISYEHNEEDITCTCTSRRDGNMTFTLPGPLIRY